MPIEPGRFRSNYKTGEIRALIAPLLGCSAEDLSDVLIIARSANDCNLGVFSTMQCSQPVHGHVKVIDMCSELIQAEVMAIYQISPQHGPEEG